MGRKSGGRWGTVAAVAAIAVCCALPALVVLAGGALAAIGGAAVRYWPLTAVGIAAIGWASLRVARVVRMRSRSDGESVSNS